MKQKQAFRFFFFLAIIFPNKSVNKNVKKVSIQFSQIPRLFFLFDHRSSLVYPPSLPLPHLGRPWSVLRSDTSAQSCRIGSSAASRCEQLPCSCPPSYWYSSWAQGGRTLAETHLKDRGRTQKDWSFSPLIHRYFPSKRWNLIQHSGWKILFHLHQSSP